MLWPTLSTSYLLFGIDYFILISSLFTLAINSFIYCIQPPIIPASELDRDFSYSTLVKESRLETSTILSVKIDLEKAVPIPILSNRTISLVNRSSSYPFIS